jgi:hypothetical protein
VHVKKLKLSFQEWTQQVQEMLNTKKFGDIAFRDKDFKTAIDYYSKVSTSLFSSFVCNYGRRLSQKEPTHVNWSEVIFLSGWALVLLAQGFNNTCDIILLPHSCSISPTTLYL